MTDTHCHLSFSQYDSDREAVLHRAVIVGVTHIVNPGTGLAQSEVAVQLARSVSTPRVSAAVGVHPQDLTNLSEEGFRRLEELAADPAVVAIGEVGLEQSARAPALALQQRWLGRFLDLAKQVDKALIFHVRNAHKEFRHFLERVWAPAPPKPREGQRGVVHCFSGTLDDADFYIARGLLLGITGIVTFPNAEELRGVVTHVGIPHLLLETDAPFLAPQSHRGQRDEPAYVVEVAQEIARITDRAVEEIERVTDLNAQRLFRLEP